MTSLENKPLLLFSLPNDLLLNCIARISRLYYPTLSLVSKTFRSLLTSPELYKTRSLLNHTENCLYVCLRLGPFPYDYRWFTLSLKPNQTLTNHTSKKRKRKQTTSGYKTKPNQTLTNHTSKKTTSGYVLAKVPVPHSRPVRSSSLVVVGSDIYNIGETIYGLTCFKVSILDCQSHTWRDAPSLNVKLCKFSANVVDKKLYLAGSYRDGGSLKRSFQVLDMKEQVWNSCMDKDEVIACSSKKARRGLTNRGMTDLMLPESYCEIENVLYSAFHGELRWYNTKFQKWTKLKGLVGQPECLFRFDACSTLAKYGGNWDENLPVCGTDKIYEKRIWCAVITLERSGGAWDIYGRVEWFDHVLTVPKDCNFVKALAVII